MIANPAWAVLLLLATNKNWSGHWIYPVISFAFKSWHAPCILQLLCQLCKRVKRLASLSKKEKK